MITEEARRRLQGLGTPDNLGLIVSVAERDVPYITPEEAQERIQVATELEANAVYGGFPEVTSGSLAAPTSKTRSILVLTNEIDVFQDVREAMNQNVEAVGTPWDVQDSSYSQGSRFRTVRSIVDRYQGVLPVFASIYADAPPIELSLKSSNVKTVIRYGTDAVILPWTRNSADVISSLQDQDSSQSVPAFLRVLGSGGPLDIFSQVARAKDSGASGIVMGKLSYPQYDGVQAFRRRLSGVRDVLNGMTPETVARNLGTTRRQF